MPNNNIVYLPLSQLKLWQDNYKTHDEAFLVERILVAGFTDPLGVKDCTVYTGNGRLKALRRIKAQDFSGFNEDKRKQLRKLIKSTPVPHYVRLEDDDWLIPCIDVSHLSDKELLEHAIAHNNAQKRSTENRVQLRKISKKHDIDLQGVGFTKKQSRTIQMSLTQIDKPAQSTKQDVPYALFPCESQYGIPLLDASMQAQYLEQPLIKWGSKGRTLKHAGTVHFYADDYKFSALRKNPKKLVDTDCPVVIEPNETILDEYPKALVLEILWWKRYMARYWQSQGIRVLVDMNVGSNYGELNLLGVPKGWGAYATRALVGQEALLDAEYDLATYHCGKEPNIFVVYGGNDATQGHCEERGWSWWPEYQVEVRQIGKQKG